MRILLNGDEREVRDGLSVAELVGELALTPEQVAVELNGRVVRRGERPAVQIAPGDRVEVVTLVGGG